MVGVVPNEGVLNAGFNARNTHRIFHGVPERMKRQLACSLFGVTNCEF